MTADEIVMSGPAFGSGLDGIPRQHDRTVETFLAPSFDMLAVVLDGIGGLTGHERAVIHQGAARALCETIRRRVSELPSHWPSLVEHHPALKQRLGTVLDNRLAAAITFAERFAADRGVLSEVDDRHPGELREVVFASGDGHRGGHTTVLLTCRNTRLVYKPLPTDAEAELGKFLARVLPEEPDRIRAPRVVGRDGYGWTEHVAHRYCASDVELRRFHRNLGRWLAVVRLLGGTGLRPESLVAAGPVPIVVDCDTLFTLRTPAAESGLGAAVDVARDLADGSVLGTGLALGHSSAFLDMPAAHLPSPDPLLGRYWEYVVTGFTELSRVLREHDRTGALGSWLGAFADVTVRAAPRGAPTYAEVSRVLWHPASLQEPEPAMTRAVDLLTEDAAAVPGAPADPYVITAEVYELLDGDLPLFTTTPGMGMLLGPRGTIWGERADLITEALDRWRGTDPDRDRWVVQAALVGASLGAGWVPETPRLLPSTVDCYGLEERRRALAASILNQIADTAITGSDGTVTWIAPVLEPSGWAVRPLPHDLYGGLAGVAVLLAAYRREQAAGRADDVPGLTRLLKATMRTMRLAERSAEDDPPKGGVFPGAYIGLGSRISGWLLLRRLGAGGDEALARAVALAGQIEEAVLGDPAYDLLAGRAGGIVPLLRLADHTGDERWSELAAKLGDQLVAAATPVETGTGVHAVCWPTARYPHGVGGFAHGATGIGWALARLAAITHDRAHADTAAAAFAYERTLYDPAQGGWHDRSGENQIGTAWCHGSTGIGVAALDLMRRGGDYADDWRETVWLAAASSWDRGAGWNHSLCHGDFGVWEVVSGALDHRLAPAGLDQSIVDAQLLAAVEEFGVQTGTARDAFLPGLLSGAGGVAYQLLRMHPECKLPSVLLPDPGPVSRIGGSAGRASAGPGRSSSR